MFILQNFLQVKRYIFPVSKKQILLQEEFCLNPPHCNSTSVGKKIMMDCYLIVFSLNSLHLSGLCYFSWLVVPLGFPGNAEEKEQNFGALGFSACTEQMGEREIVGGVELSFYTSNEEIKSWNVQVVFIQQSWAGISVA